MGLAIMLTNQGAAVAALCDVCGAWIETAAEGGYAWNQTRDESGAIFPLVLVHKGNCFLTYEAAHPDAMDMELSVLPPYLAASLDVDWDKAIRLARCFSTP